MPRRTQGGGARDELARSLRALRDAAGLSQTEAGEQTETGQRAVSRFEAGLYLPATDELDRLLGLYKADPELARRLRAGLAARLAEPAAPRFIARAGSVASIQRRTRLLEARSEVIEAFQTSAIVGLVQTQAYIRAVFDQPEVNDVENSIAERVARQRQVIDSDRHVVIVHTEGALRAHLKAPSVMIDQLTHLAKLAVARTNLRVGVIPWWQPVSRPLMSGFRLFDRKVLAVSSETGELFPPDESVIAEHGQLFDQVVDWADFGEAAAEHCTRIAGEYGNLAC